MIRARNASTFNLDTFASKKIGHLTVLWKIVDVKRTMRRNEYSKGTSSVVREYNVSLRMKQFYSIFLLF